MKGDKRTYFFLGIGGIGMSALARYLLAEGMVIHGYDRSPSDLTAALEQEGMKIIYQDDVKALDAEIRTGKLTATVVYTPAIPADNSLLQYFKENQFELIKRAAMLGQCTADTVNLSVAGTHGKTTTSSMLASIFKASDKPFYAFLGGISADLGSNFYHQTGAGKQYSITEADEYDRSFLQLNPSYAIITSTDADHLDIYGNADQIEASFEQFAALIANSEQLIHAEKAKISRGKTYGFSKNSDYRLVVHQRDHRGSVFSIFEDQNELAKEIRINIPGDHNVENAMAASLLALKCGIPLAAVQEALGKFKGIKRRFEFIIEREDLVYIDDYAHHPGELEAIISSARTLYPDRKLTGVFQPHLYSRTRDFADGFARTLSQLDELILLPIYPARELPMQGVDSSMILERATLENKRLLEKEDLLTHLNQHKPEVLLTLGAGDIDRFPVQIKKLLDP